MEHSLTRLSSAYSAATASTLTTVYATDQPAENMATKDSSVSHTESILTQDVVECARANPNMDNSVGAKLRKNITGSQGSIRLDARELNRTERAATSGSCTYRVVVPDDNMVLRMQVSANPGSTKDCNSGFLDLRVNDVTTKSLLVSICLQRPPVTYSASHGVDVTISILGLSPDSGFFLNWTAVPAAMRPSLERVEVTNVTGYLQTPGWDGHAEYPPNMDSWIQLTVTPYDAIMVSAQHMNVSGLSGHCNKDRATIYVGGNTSRHLLQDFILCGRKDAPPRLFFTDKVYVHFQSDHNYFNASSGFQLHYSFHRNGSVLQQLADGRWNCSVSHWRHSQHHFPCNLVRDCAGGEDEAPCPYVSPQCGSGAFSLGWGDSCYHFLSRREFQITWRAASLRCVKMGGHLASLNTLQEWRNLTSLFVRYKVQVYLGLQFPPVTLPALYRGLPEWSDGSPAYLVNLRDIDPGTSSVFYLNRPWEELPLPDFRELLMSETTKQTKELDLDAVCETKLKSTDRQSVRYYLPDRWDKLRENLTGIKDFQCPDGHLTHDFLVCDWQTSCLARDSMSALTCDPPQKPAPPMMVCNSGLQRVPYSLVCDFVPDCNDHSDEDFCVFPTCLAETTIVCGNKQCVPSKARCDGHTQCKNGMDEMLCLTPKASPAQRSPFVTLPPPAIVNLNGDGSFNITPTSSSRCPESHFRCGNDGYCLPVFVRCNGVHDCPGREDEEDCSTYACPGFYRCRASRQCLHPLHLCDGVFHCSQQDDELFCRIRCPSFCKCYGHAFICWRGVDVQNFTEIRFLHIERSGMAPSDVSGLPFLIYLGLPASQIKDFTIPYLSNLRVLDLSHNELTAISFAQLEHVQNLLTLVLAGNPLILPELMECPSTKPSLRDLDLTGVVLPHINVSTLSCFPNLQRLNMSSTNLMTVTEDGFKALPELRELDVTGCPLTSFPTTAFQNTTSLQLVLADNYKLCCPATLPRVFNLANCHAPADEISSCDALLRNDLFRVVLAVFSSLSLLGNMVTFCYRLRTYALISSYGVFVSHLSIADMFMGVYLGVIGIADRKYLGTYLWKDVEWKNSSVCSAAGCLSLLSHEVSALIICLITLDRFYVIRFPFSSAHFKPRSAHVACCLAWSVGLVMAIIPLTPSAAHWNYYSHTGICIPLPFNRKQFPGHSYSFGVMIVLNFVLFLLIAAGQLSIYWSIRANSITLADTSRKSKDLVIARRLFTVVMSDFVCLFPITVLGLLAANGMPVSGEVNVVVAILVLPLNSALNPFLYTLNTVLEKRRRARDRDMLKRLTTQIITASNITRQTFSKYTQTV